MRIGRLDLLRYGRFTDISLELPLRNPDVHVVFGPNEAGKSTALAAIEDVLFGIPRNSPFGFLHDYANMRIGAVLENAKETLEIRRRKGNKDTLLTPDELPIPAGDGVLAPFLASADRPFLTRMFTLDHTRLRQGGREILEAQDEIGQVLFSAGAGLSGLSETLKTLQDEADSLWAPRRAARRRYYQAEGRLREADANLRTHIVTGAKWQDAKRAFQEADESCAILDKQIERASAEQRKLGRIRRVYRNVHRKQEIDRRISELGEVATLPDGALQTLQDAEREDSSALAGIEALRPQLESARTARSTLNYDESLILHEEDIATFHERRITVKSGRADLPKRQAELEAAEADLRRLAKEIEWSADATDQIIERIPARAKVRPVRTLINHRGEYRSSLDNARSAANEAEIKTAKLLRQLSDVGDAANTSNLAAVTKTARHHGDIAAQLRTAEAEVEKAKADFRRQLECLRPAIEDEKALGALAVPPLDVVQAHRDASRDLNQKLESCRERIEDAKRKRDNQKRAYERLQRDEGVVAADDLTSARKRRDAGWSLIRRKYVDRESVPNAEMEAFVGAAGRPVDAYENAVRSADDLADRRFDKAEAAARLAVTKRDLEETQDQLHSLENEKEALENKRLALDAEWHRMWTEAPLEPRTPNEMLEWIAAWKEAIVTGERRSATTRDLATLRDREASARTAVVDELAELGIERGNLADRPLAFILEVAADVLRGQERVAEKRHQLNEAHREAAADTERKRKSVEKFEAQWSEWQNEWADAVAALGIDKRVNVEAVAAQIDTIDEMRSIIVKVNELRYERIGQIEGKVAAFRQDVATLVEIESPDLAGLDPEEAVVQLEQRLEEAKDIRTRAEAKDKEVASLGRQIDKYKSERRNAQETINGLLQAGGVPDVDQLKGVIAKSDELHRLRGEREQLIDALGSEGDGLSVEELAEECGDVDLDQASTREEQLGGELKELRERLLDARERRTEARQAFESIGGDGAGARAAAARQEALSEMRIVAEQYTRTRVAAMLLRWAIDRYRREKQAPLLERASRLFATLTNNSFGRLQVEFDEQDHAHLVGVRSDGDKVLVPGMSTGTADQLYLALRIASVIDYLDRAPPLPFVADDLFINFDDERTAKGFRVLGELGKATQVLVFTHHEHIADIAQTTLGPQVPIVSL